MKSTHPIVDVVIPAYNEEMAIGKVINDLPREIVRYVWVVNNGSTDNTPEVAKEAGAIVINEPIRGYGRACLSGIKAILKNNSDPYILVFLDGDYSDYPEETIQLIQPIVDQKADLVIGARSKGHREKGAMTLPQIFGNWLATRLMKYLYNANYTDLGPFRAIKFQSLLELEMTDKNYGWTVETQIKAIKKGLQVCEIPVNYKRRIGKSKVSGTVKGIFSAGYKIIFTIFRYL